MTEPEKGTIWRENDMYFFHCPSCGEIASVPVNQTNCCIFRHAVLRENFEPIPPHSAEGICNDLVQKGLVFGCAQPFKLDISTMRVERCGWI